MIRRSFTAVLDRNAIFEGDFETEPYEASWASEAQFFIRVLEIHGDGACLDLKPQISPDGLFWCDEGTAELSLDEVGLFFFPLREFGHWLRLKGQMKGHGASIKTLIYLALKE